MGPRSHERGNLSGNVHPCAIRLLQWGRVLMNAETANSYRWPALGLGASMGPRSHERGNHFPFGRLAEVAPLQWGRVLMNAETHGVAGR